MQKLLKNHVFGLIAWILILLISVIALPNVGELTSAHSTITLPKDVQSEVAQTIQNDWGKKKKNTYEVAIVFNMEHGKLTEADKAAINATVDRLQNNKEKYGITDVLAPDSNIATRKKLQSKDGTTWVMQLNISKKKGNESRSIGSVEDQIKGAAKTSGVRTYVTGADILTNAFSTSIQEGIKKTEAITVVFIFIVLIIVFKSPIVPLISLLTVGVSFLTSFSIVTNLVQHANFPFSNFTQVFMVIVLFGIGTDYNILLYDKFKENLGKGMDKYKAMHDALINAGKTILYSGSSILIGFTALSLARFSVYQSAVGVAVGVAVLLVVLLTLNPFFMAVLGKKLFWPSKQFNGESEDKLWHAISAGTLKRPIIYLLVLAVVTIPFMLMYSGHLNYDDTDEIADNVPAKKGFLVVQKHFSKGLAEPSYLYIKSNHRLDNEKNLKLIDQLTKQLQASKDVDFATSVTEPYGEAISQLYLNDQLGTVNSGVDQVRTGLGKLSKGSQKAADGAQQLQDGTSRLQSGADQLQSGTAKLQSGASQLQSGAIRLQTGAGRLESGTSSLVSGANRLQSGAGSLKNGTSSLASGTQTLVNGLNQLSSQLSSQMSSSNKAQLAQLQTALPQINNGIQALNKQVGGMDVSGLTKQLSGLQAQIKQAQTAAQSQATKAVNDASTAAATAAIETIVKQEAANGKKVDQSSISAAQAAAASAAKAAAAKAAAGSSTTSTASSFNPASLTATLNQVNQLQAAVKQLATASNKALPGAATALNQLSSGLSQVQSAAAQGSAGASRLQAGANKLNAGAGQLYNGLGTLSSGASRLGSGASQLNSGLGTLSNGASQLNNGLAQGASGASQLSNGIGQLNSGAGRLASSMPKITNGLDQANSGLGQGGAYLQGLQASAAADTFYIPKEFIKNEMFQKSMNVYLSPNKKSALLIVVFKSNPSATEATERSHELSAMAKKSLQGTALKNAKVAMGGQSSKIQDTKTVASGDFIRTAAIMLVGIGIALMLVTRSILQPVYILGTLLIAYLCSLSINQWIVKAVLGRSMLTWNTPFFSFIMLIALGVDYSIFLMTRYRELETEGIDTPSSRILKACGIIGTVVVSAAIILGGTFAALIPSGIPTLIEVALTVDIGLLILVFILPITLSAGVKLTYEGIKIPWGKRKK
ncbi:MMPL family transporter [Lactobacillus sp. HT06-2]|uniref:MMPL family transporter n=1 Tax=Lactobacillus sp. HT06-2 TaxID=2080222 RepID=UPI000CD9D9D6|nr:MMPL family transporter [Lactobacillus sp. HT06-2]